jgi:hypothetical protein
MFRMGRSHMAVITRPANDHKQEEGVPPSGHPSSMPAVNHHAAAEVGKRTHQGSCKKQWNGSISPVWSTSTLDFATTQYLA